MRAYVLAFLASPTLPPGHEQEAGERGIEAAEESPGSGGLIALDSTNRAEKAHDVNALDWIVFEAGAFYAMDRGYLDFERLARIDAARAFFVTRAKSKMSFYVRESRPVDKASGLRADQAIRLNGPKTKDHYSGDI